MKFLFIGGTGNISTACSRLAAQKGHEVWVLNRSKTSLPVPDGIRQLQADIQDENRVKELMDGHHFDAVVNFIAFEAADIARDIRLFRDRTDQYVFISSASAYQKPLSHPVVTESTPLANPVWQYSRDKIACEDALMQAYRDFQFPITIVRPSLTYEYVIPVPIGGWKHYNIVDRIRKREPVIVHGDGTSLWTITHSRDFAVGFVGLLGLQQAIGHAFHITSDEILTWDQIYQAVGMAVGEAPRIVHIASDLIAKFEPSRLGSLVGDKSVSVIFDNTKIKTFVPEFKAVIPFKQGIRETIDWFEADPSRQMRDPATEAWVDRLLAAYASIGGL
ncbi:SDR family oxidoreductase [Flavilitoribacter nigricans]|uniref:NAD-dependent dehydratase n=1 Tax=Flavilitoribacter nigricans (strain ATCC 23147 / DSM 23189 / NBRC 102662 / NCIMB 1420 / SS-2) TaxID=1122177 RepID=A0A2D0N3B9_FLAN2|nr:SDR family oxidoreductase [Flavilitoribacter nigricans]PHN02890.1 NAD-dependent dehydratase [Flavilitoribacter nigricans DSM 23189 = NBRC 102662]